MRGFYVWLLLKKELLEVVRDRRSIFLMVVLPMLMYPGIVLVAGQVTVEQAQEIAESTSRVGIVGAPVRSGLAKVIDEAENIERVPLPLTNFKTRDQPLRSGKVDVLLVLPADIEEKIRAFEPAAITVLYDETNEVSVHAHERVRKLLRSWADHIIKERLATRKLSPQFVRPLAIEVQSVATPAEVGGHLLGKIVPLLLMLMIVVGAFYPAVEVTAGEKERGTLQTLLTAPIRPLEIVTGKFLSVFVVAMITALANVLSIILMVLLGTAMAPGLSESLVLTPSFGVCVLVALSAVLACLLFSAVMMTVAVLARTTREAQTYMTPVYLVSILPVFLTQLPGITLNASTAVAPVVNLALLLRDLMEGVVEPQLIFLVVVTNVLFTMGALLLAAKIFRHETILLGDAGARGLFSRGKQGQRRLPTAGEALSMMVVVFLLFFYAGSLLQAKLGLSGLVISQWCLLLIPVLLYVRWKRANANESLGLYRPTWRSIAAGILLGAALWYPILCLARLLLPADLSSGDSAQEQFILAIFRDNPSWMLVFVLGVTPAICEEFLFRGLLLQALLKHVRPVTAIVVTGVLFGAFHMSLIRFIPTTLIGMLLAWMAFRCGSIIPGVILHLLNNSASVFLFVDQAEVPGATVPGVPVWWHAALAALALGVGAALVASHRRDTEFT